MLNAFPFQMHAQLTALTFGHAITFKITHEINFITNLFKSILP